MPTIEEIKQYGKENNVPISKDDTLAFLCQKSREVGAKIALEIGTAIGYSSIALMQNTNLEHIDTLEIDHERVKLARNNINSAGFQNKIMVHEIDAMQYLKQNTKTYDFIYLDGPKGQYINYLPYLLKALNKNGVLVADNLFFHGMVTGEIPVSKGCRAMIKGLKNYIEAITTNPALSTEILKIGDGVGVTTFKK